MSLPLTCRLLYSTLLTLFLSWPAVLVAQPPEQTSSAIAEHALVNINTADAETLARELSGVGPAKAAAIVAWREANGPFVVVDQLTAVKGIGDKILERNLHKLCVD